MSVLLASEGPKMAQPINAGQLLELTTYCRMSDQNSLNVGHFYVTAKTGTVTDTALVSAWSQMFADELKPLMAPDASYKGLKLQVMKPTKFDYQTSTTGNGVGTRGTECIPSQVAALIRLRTGLGGRKYRGRKFIAFPDETANTASGDPTVDYRGELTGIADLWGTTYAINLGGGNTVTVQPVLFHRADGSYTYIGSYEIQAKWATQRRRSEINQNDALFP